MQPATCSRALLANGRRGRLCGLVDHLGRDFLRGGGVFRQDGDPVAIHLRETAIHEHPAGGGAIAVAELADAKLAHERRPAGEDSQFAIVGRDHDGFGLDIERFPLGRNHLEIHLLVRHSPARITIQGEVAKRGVRQPAETVSEGVRLALDRRLAGDAAARGPVRFAYDSAA